MSEKGMSYERACQYLNRLIMDIPELRQQAVVAAAREWGCTEKEALDRLSATVIDAAESGEGEE